MFPAGGGPLSEIPPIQLIEEVFNAALALQGDQRLRWVLERCGNDRGLYREARFIADASRRPCGTAGGDRVAAAWALSTSPPGRWPVRPERGAKTDRPGKFHRTFPHGAPIARGARSSEYYAPAGWRSVRGWRSLPCVCASLLEKIFDTRPAGIYG